MLNESQLYCGWTVRVCWKNIYVHQIRRQKSKNYPTNFRLLFPRTKIKETKQESKLLEQS